MPIEHCGDAGLGHWLEHDREQTRRTDEIALPQLVAARARERRVDHLAHLPSRL
jgi:chorismate-pyruvate lyase